MKINMNNYKDVLKGLSIVEVSGESCANCISLIPILNKIVGVRNDCKLHHLEVSEDTMPLVEAFDVQAVPTILILMDDIVEAKCRGYQPEEILEIWIDAKIEDIKKKYFIENNSQ